MVDPDTAVSKHRDVNVRLVFDVAKPQDIKLWSAELRSSGLSILSESSTGIDAKGKIIDIERALRTVIDISKPDNPVIGNIGRMIEKSKVQPIAYIPRKPTYF